MLHKGLVRTAGKLRPRLGNNIAHAGQEPLHFRATTEEYAAQYHAGNPIRMHHRIGNRQSAAPRTAKQQPLLHAQVAAQRIHVGNQMRRRIIGQRSTWSALATTALIEQDDAEKCSIEKSAVGGTRLAARSAVHEKHRESFGISALLEINPMSPAHLQPIAAKRL